MSILEQKWRKLSKEPICDLKAEVSALIKHGSPRPVHVGTDAQKHGKYTDFVTCVVILDPGHGGVAFYTKTRHPYMKSLQHKLFTEVSLSLEVALALCEIAGAENIQVHVDANTNLKWESGPYHQRLAGMVVAHGFKCLLKPESWAATHVADHAARGKNDASPMSKRERRRRLGR